MTAAESALTQVLLLTLLGTSIVSAILDWPTDWLIPVLLLALFLTVRLLTQLTTSNRRFEAKLDKILDKAELAVVTEYSDSESFYQTLALQIRPSLRQPPAHIPEGWPTEHIYCNCSLLQRGRALGVEAP